jgi:hypothetical protein
MRDFQLKNALVNPPPNLETIALALSHYLSVSLARARFQSHLKQNSKSGNKCNQPYCSLSNLLAIYNLQFTSFARSTTWQMPALVYTKNCSKIYRILSTYKQVQALAEKKLT